MIELYPQIKLVHIAAVIASGSLFFLRGLAIQLGARWAMAAPLRYLSYAIDTVLLTAALMLVTILHQYPFVNDWLTVKVVLLVVYITLGTFALKRGRTRQIRLICWLAAVWVFLFIVSVALAHDPLGIVARPHSAGSAVIRWESSIERDLNGPREGRAWSPALAIGRKPK